METKRPRRETPELLKPTKREKRELVFEGILTLWVVFVLYLGILLILDTVLDAPLLQGETVRGGLGLTSEDVVWLKFIYTGASIVFAVLFTYWRLIRRYHQMQLHHILDELHFIALGQYNRRIPFQLHGDMGKVVTSINRLVDSTVEAMEEERRIEKSKDELITNISHDIRTPLTSIIGYLGLIVEDGALREETKRYAQIAYSKSQQMKMLVDDLFEYTTTGTNGIPLRLDDIPLVPFVTQVVADMELEAQKRGMTIDVESNTNIVWEMDANKMVRVIQNLLSNAIKYGEPDSVISVQIQQTDVELVIRVTNVGEPIEKEVLEKLFHRFYRMESSRSKETGGSGLGLAIADNIVRMHGGSLEASSVQRLTTFSIRLPIV